MADGVTINAGAGGPTVATDDAGAPGHVQLFKLAISADGSAVLIPADAANGLDVDVTRVQGTVTVDSELPAAAALSDTLDRAASVPIVGAAPLVDNGTNLVRLRGAVIADASAGAGVPASGAMVWNANLSTYHRFVSPYSDTMIASGLPSAVGVLYNGTNFERARSNIEGTVLASAARAASPSISNITNNNARGIRLFLNVTATPNNAETLTVAIEWVDPVSAAVKALTAFPAITASVLGASPAAGVREFVFELYPGAIETAAVANHEVQGGSLPRTLHPKVTHSSTGSWTYSLGYALEL
jgi:hypothetical protein